LDKDIGERVIQLTVSTQRVGAADWRRLCSFSSCDLCFIQSLSISPMLGILRQIDCVA